MLSRHTVVIALWKSLWMCALRTQTQTLISEFQVSRLEKPLPKLFQSEQTIPMDQWSDTMQNNIIISI